MKNKIILTLVAALFVTAGCNTPVDISGDYSTPKQNISGAVNTGTNGVTVSGGYSTTNQAVNGTVTVGK